MPIMIFSPVYFFFGTPSISMVARIYLQWSQSWDCTYRWYLCSYFPSFVDLLALTEKVFTYQESYLAHLSNLGNGAWSCLVSLPFFLRPQRGPVARKGVRRAVGTGSNCPRTLGSHLTRSQILAASEAKPAPKWNRVSFSSGKFPLLSDHLLLELPAAPPWPHHHPLPHYQEYHRQHCIPHHFG